MPLAALKQRRTKFPVPRPRDLQRQRSHPRGQLAGARTIAMALAGLCAFVAIGLLQLIGDLGFENLLQHLLN